MLPLNSKLSQNIKIKTNYNFAYLIWSETWSLKFRHMGRQSTLKFMVLRRVFGCKREEWQEAGENEMLMTLVIHNLCEILG